MVAVALIIAAGFVAGTVLGREVVRALAAKWEADRLARSAEHGRAMAIESRRVAVEERRAGVAEREMTLREHQAQHAKDGESMPPDMVSRITAWEDDFAQEDERRNILALYALHRDWDAVRAHLPALAPGIATDTGPPREGLIQ